MANINGQPVNGAKLNDLEMWFQMGIDPKTGLPLKFCLADDYGLKNGVLKLLRVQDEVDAVRRYRWKNLPYGITADLIERILWYKGQGALFYLPTNDRFYFLPFALNGNIDCYGRYTEITPLPFNGTSEDSKNKTPFIAGLTRKPVYDLKLDEVTAKDLRENCVILTDYTRQMSQSIMPRQQMNEPILNAMAECIPMARTALINSTGVGAMRVGSADEAVNVTNANEAIKQAALTGQPNIPVIGNVDFQDLSAKNPATAENFLQTMQSLDNFRLSTYGLDNGGLFAKKAHELQTESDMNSRKGSRALQDGLTCRQDWADLCNTHFGLDIDVEVSESEVGDINMDGTGYDDNNMDRMEEEQQYV